MQRCRPVKISSSKLTTCSVANDGSKVRLEFLDQSGATVTLELPLEQAEVVVMTLPHLLASAVRQKTGNQQARYVFGLHEWALEGSRDQRCLIAMLISRSSSARNGISRGPVAAFVPESRRCARRRFVNIASQSRIPITNR
jgi:hypothetical protein